MKKLFVLLFLVCICLTSFASVSISDYKTPVSVNLGEMITATGVLSDTDTNLVSNFLCAFYFLDENGVLVKRATDQYTSSTGRFAMLNVYATEPIFKRGQDYNILTECKGVVSNAQFSVSQRESIARVGSQEFEYITNPENTDTLFIWGSIVGLIILLFGFLFLVVKLGRGK